MTGTIQNRRPIGVDLFAGAGGMTLGFEQAGFDVLAAVEIDPIHCATHEFNFPFWSILCKSVAETSAVEIRKRSSIGDRDIDVVFGGPPCQGFSTMGKRHLDDPRNSLVFDFMRLVVELNPKIFVMENVRGLAQGRQREFLLEAISEFKASGYDVREDYQVLNAACYGVPQNRERLFLIGCRRGVALPEYPAPISRPINLKNLEAAKKSAEADDLPRAPNVWEAIGDLPDIENYPKLRQRDYCLAEYGEPKSDYAKLLRGLVSLESDRSYPRQYNPRMLTSSLRTNHTQKSISRFAETPQGKTEPKSRFYRLHPQGLCNTLRAGTPSNRGAHTSPRPIHPYQPRCITVREAARLHSYPDWFRFHGTKWHGFRQIGNSVPPLLAKAVAAEICITLGVEPSKPAETKYRPLGEEKLLYFNMSQASQHCRVDSRAIEPRKRQIL